MLIRGWIICYGGRYVSWELVCLMQTGTPHEAGMLPGADLPHKGWVIIHGAGKPHGEAG